MRSLRVLVAEDNKVNQFVASRILHAMGPNYVIVENGREAVAAFAQRDFHFILMVLNPCPVVPATLVAPLPEACLLLP